MIELRAVEVSEYYIKHICNAIRRYLNATVYGDIFSILKQDFVINNANDVLITAIKAGIVYYANGAFRAERFSNSVANELENIGAKFRNGAYYIEPEQIPPDIESAISLVRSKTSSQLSSIKDLLKNISLQNADVSEFVRPFVEKAFMKLERDLRASAKEKRIPIIEIPIERQNVEIPKAQVEKIQDYWEKKEAEAARLRQDWLNLKEFSEKEGTSESKKAEKEARARLNEFQKQKYKNAPKFDYTFNADGLNKQVAENYTYNLKYWIKDWQAKDITRMREDVADMYKNGVRIAEVKKYFENRWKIASNKAEFLARNEIGLASTAVKKYEYQNMGATHFKWLQSASKEKRELHKKYYGKIFSFDKPPLIDERLGIYGLPKEIWNCSCGLGAVVPETNIKVQNAKRNIFKSLYQQFKNRDCEYRRYTDR